MPVITGKATERHRLVRLLTVPRRNFPQAFNYLSLISAAINLDYQLDHGPRHADQVLAAGR
jgi:hypothetical protein